MTAGVEGLLGEQGELLLRVVDATPSPMVVFLHGEGIKHVNRRFEEVFGWSREEMLAHSYEVLAPERFRAAMRARVEEFVGQDPPRAVAWRPDFLVRRRDGTEFPIQYAAVPFPGPEGLWVVVTLHDVTSLRDSEQAAQAETRRYLTLARLNEAVARAQDATTLFDETCRIAVEVGGFVCAWVAEGSAGRPLRRVASCGVGDDIASVVDRALARGDDAPPSPTRQAVQTERSVFVNGIGSVEDDGWQAAAGDAGHGSVASLPLFRGGRAVAALTLVAENPADFDVDTRELLEGLARSVSIALDAFEAQARTERLAVHRRNLLRRLMDVQESERDRIAADIHDDSVQALAAIDLRLGMVRRRAREVAPELAPALGQIWDVLGSATASLRHLLFSLEAPDVDAGLRASLVEAAEHVFLESPVRVEVHSDDSELPDLLLGQALRIVKEALTNVHRHSGAATVWIDVNRSGQGVEIRVRDDGNGPGPVGPDAQVGPDGQDGRASPAASTPGVTGRVRGIVAMRERAELSGGSCVVTPGPEGRGTEVLLWLPDQLEEGVPLEPVDQPLD
ncbi:MAG: domain S-box protein [Marmoricola sp.]|nr:domain S-box protein [Marmoricola sp.]